jgi:opacity protein-like surface antigen
MLKFGCFLGLLLSAAASVAAQDFPRAEFFAGYTNTHVWNSNGDRSSSNGGSADVAFYPTHHFGIVADFGGSASNGFTNSSGVSVATTSHSFRFLFGPRVRFGNDRVTPYIHLLVGGVHRSDVVNGSGTVLVAAQTSFGLAAGGGVDFKVAHHFSIRAVEVNYLYTRFSPPGVQNRQNDISITAGFVIH